MTRQTGATRHRYLYHIRWWRFKKQTACQICPAMVDFTLSIRVYVPNRDRFGRIRKTYYENYKTIGAIALLYKRRY
jgi:predicted secreted Zn-dependent protease